MEVINTGHIWHFVPKAWDPADLLVVVRRAAERLGLSRQSFHQMLKRRQG